MTRESYFMITVFVISIIALSVSCTQRGKGEGGGATDSGNAGQALIQDNGSAKNIVQVAVASKDHTTLVAALKAADLVDVLANPGPFTVFAPTNSAFEKLPKGTVETLLKPEHKIDLQNILQYHVAVGAIKASGFQNGQILGEVNGDSVTMGVKDGQVTVNGAKIIATITTSNGIIHVIDTVLLPPAKK
jgi:uncharacterized surface protein with fasciclin (FAS1) repeats